MSNAERESKASVSTIWSDAVLDGEIVRISTVPGNGRIIIGGFDIHVNGNFDGNVDEVLAALKMQQVGIDKAIANLPDDWEKSSCGEDNCGLIPISDEELEKEIREFNKQRKVICMKTGKTI